MERFLWGQATRCGDPMSAPLEKRELRDGQPLSWAEKNLTSIAFKSFDSQRRLDLPTEEHLANLFARTSTTEIEEHITSG